MKPLITLPWGKVYYSRELGDLKFKGDPDKYANALVKQYGNLAAALGFVVALKEVSQTSFFTRVHNILTNRIMGKKRSERVPGGAAEVMQ